MHRNWKQFCQLFWLFSIGLMLSLPSFAQTPEKTKVSIAVGGKNLFYYLPLTIAEQRGYFKDEGLDVTILNFPGGSKALQALVGGSADVVSGAFDHTISMWLKHQPITAFVVQGRTPQIVMAVSTKTMPHYQSIKDLKGKKIGISAPGSATNIMSNFVLAQGGLNEKDVSYISVGTTASALAALRKGEIDAIVNVDPLITMLEQKKEIKIISDARTMKETQNVFHGEMLGGTLYTGKKFIEQHPDIVQALTNAMVRALLWIKTASPSDIVKTVPESYLLGDRDLYETTFQKVRESISPDGLFPDTAPAVAFQTLVKFTPALAAQQPDFSQTYTNVFVEKAHAKYQ